MDKRLHPILFASFIMAFILVPALLCIMHMSDVFVRDLGYMRTDFFAPFLYGLAVLLLTLSILLIHLLLLRVIRMTVIIEDDNSGKNEANLRKAVRLLKAVVFTGGVGLIIEVLYITAFFISKSR